MICHEGVGVGAAGVVVAQKSMLDGAVTELEGADLPVETDRGGIGDPGEVCEVADPPPHIVGWLVDRHLRPSAARAGSVMWADPPGSGLPAWRHAVSASLPRGLPVPVVM